MRQLIRLFDRFLRHANGVFDFSPDPNCLLRLRRLPSPRTITIQGFTISQGEPVVELHYFNERMPAIPEGGSDVVWATRFSRLMIHSFHQVAVYLNQHEELRSTVAVVGTTVLSGAYFERMGFTIVPAHSPLGRFGLFWDNLYAWGLMWTYNPSSLRGRNLLSMERIDIWMTRRGFMDRYLKIDGMP